MPLAPKRNQDGEVVAHNDPAIDDASMLIRYINVREHVIYDENLRRRRISSAAFSASSGDPNFGMSVDLGQLLAEGGLSESARVPAGMGAVKLQVGPVRSLNLRVGSDQSRANKYHGQVWDVKSGKRSKLHKLVLDWVAPIDDVTLR